MFRLPFFTKKSAPPSTEEPLNLAALRRLNLGSRLRSNHAFLGGYRSSFRGNGMQFREVREYQPGDDIRFIEWNASARSGGSHTYTKVFNEERELTLYLMVDQSLSMMADGQPGQRRKAMELAALLGLAATEAGDRLGYVGFAHQVLDHLAPQKGMAHLHAVLRRLQARPQHLPAGTSLQAALRYVLQMVPHKSVLVMVSDFADDGYLPMLRRLASRHDCIGIQLSPQLPVLPGRGWLPVQDAEAPHVRYLRLGSRQHKGWLRQQEERIVQEAKDNFKQAGASLLTIGPADDGVAMLQQFFHRRNQAHHG